MVQEVQGAKGYKALADPRVHQGDRPQGPHSFIFMQFLGANLQNNTLAHLLWGFVPYPRIRTAKDTDGDEDAEGKTGS